MGFQSVSGLGETLPQPNIPVKSKEAIQVPSGVDFTKEAQAVGLKLYNTRPMGQSVQLTQGGKTYWTTEKDLTECACRITLMKEEEYALETDLNGIAATVLNDKFKDFNKEQLEVAKKMQGQTGEQAAVTLSKQKESVVGLKEKIVQDLKRLKDDFEQLQINKIEREQKPELTPEESQKGREAAERLVKYNKYALAVQRAVADHSKPIKDSVNRLKQSDVEEYESIQNRVKTIVTLGKIEMQPGNLTTLFNKIIDPGTDFNLHNFVKK
jgi:gas vesicle protein